MLYETNEEELAFLPFFPVILDDLVGENKDYLWIEEEEAYLNAFFS